MEMNFSDEGRTKDSLFSLTVRRFQCKGVIDHGFEIFSCINFQSVYVVMAIFFKMYIILQHPYTQSPSAPAVLHRPLLKSKIPN